MRLLLLLAALLLLLPFASHGTGPIESGGGSGLSSTSMTQKVENPELPVLVLRFDDARASNATFAWPALNSRGLDATFYVNSGLWGIDPGDPDPLLDDDRMTEAQAIAMISQGADLQSHGFDNDGCANETYDNWVELSIIPEVNWIWDNGGGLVTSHVPPGNSYYGGVFDCPLAMARYFNNVSLEGPDTNALGIAFGPTASSRFEIPNNAVQGATIDGAALLALVKASLVGAKTSQVQTISFHSVVQCDAGGGSLPTCSATIFDEDEFIIFIDGIKTLVDNGVLSVMTATEGYNHVAKHQPGFNLFVNPGLASKGASTTEADEWQGSLTTSDDSYAVVTDLNHGIGREVTFNQRTALSSFRQQVHNLTPGRQYGHSLECLCNTSDGTATLRPTIWGNGGGAAATKRGSAFACTSGQRFQVAMRWIAKSQSVMVGWEFGQQAVPIADAWTCRYPVLMEMNADGVSAFQTNFARPEKFYSTAGSGSIGAAATVVTSFDGMTTSVANDDTLRVDEGPAAFLIYKVDVDSTDPTPNVDCAFETQGSGAGGVTCDLGTITAQNFETYPSCVTVDKDAFSEGGSDAGGNELHISCTNNDGAANTLTFTVEGAILY